MVRLKDRDSGKEGGKGAINNLVVLVVLFGQVNELTSNLEDMAEWTERQYVVDIEASSGMQAVRDQDRKPNDYKQSIMRNMLSCWMEIRGEVCWSTSHLSEQVSEVEEGSKRKWIS